jgi:hypothetical protein
MKVTKLLMLTLLVAATAHAQRGVFTGITWNIGFPNQETAEYIGSTSYRGLGVDIRSFSSPSFSFGGNFSWNVYDELLRGETAVLKGGAITGTQVRYINSMPLLLNASYYPGEKRRGELRFVLGLNAGTYYIRQRLDIGVVSLENSNWHLGVAPELGLWLPIGRETFLTLTARYNYAFDAGTRLNGDPNNDYSYWGINIGIGSVQGRIF